MSRRLPIYLLLDTSGSMSGEAIQSVQQGVFMLIEALKNDPIALETAWLSVITFDASARVVCPLTDINLLKSPILSAGGTTLLGEGLKLLLKQIDTEVVKSSETQKADWKPLVFIMTDGKPKDAYEKFADELKSRNYQVIGCIAGSKAKSNHLKKITDQVVKIDDFNTKTLEAFFKWLSVSVSVSLQALNQGIDQNLPPLPDVIEWV